ncbi:MAG: response regulator [Bacteroidota bacterium]
MMKQALNLILLVDDDEDDNIYHQYIIKKSGFTKRVQAVYHGREALDYLQKRGKYSSEGAAEKPDLIFLDINMPVMNGWEFLEAYNQLDPSLQATSIIVMLTTSINPDDRDKAKQYSGVAQFLNKPLQQEDLERLIKERFPERF